MRNLSQNTVKQIAKAVSTSISADKTGAIALDALIADGFDKPSDFVSPKSKGSTVSPEEFEALNSAIVLGFTADVRKVLAKPVKSLNDEQKATRRYWQQQIGARRNDFKRQLTKRLDADKPSDGAGTRNRTPDQRIREALTDVLKVCQKADELPFNVNEFAKIVKQALALIK